MKTRLIFGILTIALGILIAWGPQTIFPICGIETHSDSGSNMSADIENTDSVSTEMSSANSTKADAASQGTAMSSPMKCHWTGRAEIGVGTLISLIGLLLILFRSKQIRFGLSLALGLNGILALLLPTRLIGVCGSTRMSCRALTFPALIVLSGLIIVIAVFNSFYLYKSDKRGDAGNEPQSADHSPVGGI